MSKWLFSLIIIVSILFWIVFDSIWFIFFERIDSVENVPVITVMMRPTIQDKNNTLLVKLRRDDPNSIVFIKTFKTAGSTLTSIFHNFCVLYNKSCPITKPYFLSRTWDFNRSDHRKDIEKIKTWNDKTGMNGNKFDMWINHILFHPFIYKLMPSAENQILTIVRDPVDRFISGFRYYKLQQTLNINISTYIKRLYNNYTKYGKYEKNYWPTPHIGYQLNSQCRSLIRGYVEPEAYDAYDVWKSIRNGDWLILITERFDESLLLLTYAYNFTLNDLSYIRKKGREKRDLYENAYNPTQDERALILKMHECDAHLYKTALEIFNHRIFQIYGNDHKRKQKDLGKLKEINNINAKRCSLLKNEKINMGNMYNHGFKDEAQYVFTKTVYCKSMNRDDILWNKWAHDYQHNVTWRDAFIKRLLRNDTLLYTKGDIQPQIHGK